MAKITRRSFSASGSTTETSSGFNPDYTYVVNNLKRIGLLALIFIGALVILSFVL